MKSFLVVTVGYAIIGSWAKVIEAPTWLYVVCAVVYSIGALAAMGEYDRQKNRNLFK
jgi:hypothetical protein